MYNRTFPSKGFVWWTGIETVGNWSGMTDINIERIVELEPDLIIMNMYSEKIYDQLKDIAPTLC